MKKDKVTMFAEESYNDLDDNIGIVMPILTDCDVDEDFTEGMEKVGEELPILPLRNMVLFPGVAMPVMIGRLQAYTEEQDGKQKKCARVVVPDDQLSLAIGKEGQNASLAAKLTGYKIDIKSESQARDLGMIIDDYDDDYADDYEDEE